LGLLDSENPKLYFPRRKAVEKVIFWAAIWPISWNKKIGKTANFKANIRLVKRDNSVQIIPIYKTFICKNMYNTLCKRLTKYS
jgi:hypothetical protein